jgi:hypothetical protein
MKVVRLSALRTGRLYPQETETCRCKIQHLIDVHLLSVFIIYYHNARYRTHKAYELFSQLSEIQSNYFIRAKISFINFAHPGRPSRLLSELSWIWVRSNWRRCMNIKPDFLFHKWALVLWLLELLRTSEEELRYVKWDRLTAVDSIIAVKPAMRVGGRHFSSNKNTGSYITGTMHYLQVTGYLAFGDMTWLCMANCKGRGNRSVTTSNVKFLPTISNSIQIIFGWHIIAANNIKSDTFLSNVIDTPT